MCGVTTEDGTVVDGTNAAEILLNKMYYLPTAEQDPFFAEVAGLAMNKVRDSLGPVSMEDFASTVEAAVSQERLLAYMGNADEKHAISSLGAEEEVNLNSQNSVAGFYVYDKAGSKLDWCLDMRSSVDEPTTNADGRKSYQVTATLQNTTALEQMEDELPAYITGQTPEASNCSMIVSFVAMAAAGGTISDFKVDADEANSEAEVTLCGTDVWAGYVNSYPSATASLACRCG